MPNVSFLDDLVDVSLCHHVPVETFSFRLERKRHTCSLFFSFFIFIESQRGWYDGYKKAVIKVYSCKYQFIEELIQNTEDNHYLKGAIPYLTFSYTGVICSNISFFCRYNSTLPCINHVLEHRGFSFTWYLCYKHP